LSGIDYFGSVVDRMNMKLGIKFLNFLKIKTQLLKRPQSLIVVNSATHSQKDGMEGNGGLERVGQRPELLLRGAQLVLRSSVLTVLDLDKVDVMLDDDEIFGLVLSGEGGSAGGGWQ